MPTMTNRQHGAAERAQRRHASGLKPDRGGDLDAVAAGESPHQPLAQDGDEPRSDENRHMKLRARVAGRRDQHRRVSRAPGEFLHDPEQQGQRGGPKSGRDAGQRDRKPEIERAGIAQRCRDPPLGGERRGGVPRLGP
jgi:hypothetical protein